MRAVAHLGGYRDRKGDPDPGNQIMWHGQTRLTSAALGHEIGRETGFRAGQRHALRTGKKPVAVQSCASDGVDAPSERRHCAPGKTPDELRVKARRRASMEQAAIIGIDISRKSLQLHGANAEGEPVFRKTLSRGRFLAVTTGNLPVTWDAALGCSGLSRALREKPSGRQKSSRVKGLQPAERSPVKPQVCPNAIGERGGRTTPSAVRPRHGIMRDRTGRGSSPCPRRRRSPP